MLEMFHCCTDALLFFMVVFKRFVIVLPFEHAKNMFYSNKGKKWLRWGGSNSMLLPFNTSKSSETRRKIFFQRSQNKPALWPSSRSESFTKWRKNSSKLSVCVILSSECLASFVLSGTKHLFALAGYFVSTRLIPLCLQNSLNSS